MKQKRYKAYCPYCGRRTSAVQYDTKANSAGVWATCKNQKCKKTFEIIIVNGKQIT